VLESAVQVSNPLLLNAEGLFIPKAKEQRLIGATSCVESSQIVFWFARRLVMYC